MANHLFVHGRWIPAVDVAQSGKFSRKTDGGEVVSNRIGPIASESCDALYKRRIEEFQRLPVGWVD